MKAKISSRQRDWEEARPFPGPTRRTSWGGARRSGAAGGVDCSRQFSANFLVWPSANSLKLRVELAANWPPIEARAENPSSQVDAIMATNGNRPGGHHVQADDGSGPAQRRRIVRSAARHLPPCLRSPADRLESRPGGRFGPLHPVVAEPARLTAFGSGADRIAL